MEQGFWGCVAWDPLPTIDPECIHQPGAEKDGFQQRARATSRYWQMALMAASQIVAVADWAKSIASTWTDTYDLLRSATEGFSLSHENRRTYLLERANYRLQTQMDRQFHMLTQYEIGDDEARFDMINTAVTDALHQVGILDESAVELSERGLELSLRLGSADVHTLLGDSLGAQRFSFGERPPVTDPGENAAAYDAIYRQILGSVPAFGQQMSVRSPAPYRSASAAAATEPCPVDVLNSEDPLVVSLRAQIMATGAQTGAKGISAEAAAASEQLRALSDLERAREEESFWRTTLRLLRSF